MADLNNPIEILKLLEKSNCRECGKPTCLAFAGAVFKREMKLEDCPRLDSGIINSIDLKTDAAKGMTRQQEEAINDLKQKIASTDLAAAAKRLGVQYEPGKLTLQCLGKNFSVDQKGNIITEIHVNPWVAIPILNYILYGKGTPPSGEWLTFRELKGGEEWYPLYSQRAEKPLRKIADTYTDLFNDMLQIFNGKRIDYHYQSDISIVLHPLPNVPILICYSVPEDGLESVLTIFYDKTIEENLNIGAVYNLIAGMVVMFGKISLRHGHG